MAIVQPSRPRISCSPSAWNVDSLRALSLLFLKEHALRCRYFSWTTGYCGTKSLLVGALCGHLAAKMTSRYSPLLPLYITPYWFTTREGVPPVCPDLLLLGYHAMLLMVPITPCLVLVT